MGALFLAGHTSAQLPLVTVKHAYLDLNLYALRLRDTPLFVFRRSVGCFSKKEWPDGHETYIALVALYAFSGCHSGTLTAIPRFRRL